MFDAKKYAHDWYLKNREYVLAKQANKKVNKNQIVQHHVKYKDIHGVDEIVLMTRSEHDKLHHRLRREGKCNIRPDILRKIVVNAHKRSDKYKIARHWFTTTIDSCITLHEKIDYNLSSGSVYILTWFSGDHGKKLYYINEDK